MSDSQQYRAALAAFQRQSNMLAGIRKRDMEAWQRSVERLQSKLRRGHRPDNLEIAFMQDCGGELFARDLGLGERERMLEERRREQRAALTRQEGQRRRQAAQEAVRRYVARGE